MRIYWVLAVIPAFVLGAGADRAFNRSAPSSVATAKEQANLAGIERLHKLDERITELNDPKALQAEWTNDFIVRTAANGSSRA